LEFYKLLKQRIYSNLNKNYRNPYTIRDISVNSLKTNDSDNFLTFTEKKYNLYTFKYQMAVDENKLIISLKLPIELSNQLNQFEIICSFMDNGTNPNITFKNILIKKSGMEFIYQLEQINIKKDEVEKSKQKKAICFNHTEKEVILKIKYSFDDLLIDLSKSNNRLCYNIVLREEVFQNRYQIIGTKFPNNELQSIKIPKKSGIFTFH